MGVPSQWSMSLDPGITPVTSVTCFHLALSGCSRLARITGLVTYTDHFSPVSPPRTICIHNQKLPVDAFPVLLCHPAYINSAQGMQELSGEQGKREAAVWQNGSEAAGGVLCDGLWLAANGTV